LNQHLQRSNVAASIMPKSEALRLTLVNGVAQHEDTSA
jgi:hypothetical protein